MFGLRPTEFIFIAGVFLLVVSVAIGVALVGTATAAAVTLIGSDRLWAE